MTARVLFDDSRPVSDLARQLAGLKSYGDLLFRGERLTERVEAAARAAGWDEFVRLRDGRDLDEELRAIAAGQGADFYLYLPATLGWAGSQDTLESFLKSLCLAQVGAQVEFETERAVCARGPVMAEFLAGADPRRATQGALPADLASAQIKAPAELVNLANAAGFVTYLTGAFAVRHFNAIENDRFTVKKTSTDRAKLKREFAYFSLLPAAMRGYFVNVFDFADDGARASYKMERILAPDLAIQWVHGAFDGPAFGKLLDRVFRFLATRERKAVSREVGRATADALYRDKLSDRLAQLKAHEAFGRIDSLVRQFPGLDQGLEELCGRYLRLYEGLTRQETFDRLEIGHGDLCFSNILYAPDTELLKFIDVRGAESPEEMFTDPLYDVAKLSHSILGRYDYINNGLFHVALDDEARLQLKVLERSQSALKAAFVERLESAGYDVRQIRLREASLFLSMLPLHMDHPKKVVAFAATAHSILNQVEAP